METNVEIQTDILPRVGAKTGNKIDKNLKPLLDPAGRPGWVCEGLVCRGRSGVGVGAKVSSRGGFASEKRPELVQLSVLFPQELLPLVLLLHPQGGVVTGADLLPAGGGGSGEGTQLLEAKRDGIGGVGGGWLEHPTRWLGAQWPGLSPPLGVPSCQARPRAAQVWCRARALPSGWGHQRTVTMLLCLLELLLGGLLQRSLGLGGD